MKIFGNEYTIQDLDYVEWVGKMTEKLENKLIAWVKMYAYIYTHIHKYI